LQRRPSSAAEITASNRFERGTDHGITRDLLIGTPPETFRDWRYLAAVGAAGVVC
jgi:hypothetical protein